jgi:hypothetical protein
MNSGAPGTERNKGDKSRIYTEIRGKLRDMERDEWRKWFGECLAALEANEELWHWLTRERKYAGRVVNGEYQRKKKGRPFNSIKRIIPDTRNTNHDVD